MKHEICRGTSNAQGRYASLACMQMTTFRMWMTESPISLRLATLQLIWEL